MKIKSFLTAVALLLSVGVMAQMPLQFGVNAGVNMSNVAGDNTSEFDAKIGFQIGVTADYALSPEMFLQSGLSLSTKGFKSNTSVLEINANAMYLQLPIRFGYKIAVSEGMKVNLNAGPYLAYGVGGKIKTKETVDNVSLEAKSDFFNDAVNKFDYGIGAGVGLEMGQINFNLGYEYGFANLNKKGNDNKYNVNSFLTVGYKF